MANSRCGSGISGSIITLSYESQLPVLISNVPITKESRVDHLCINVHYRDQFMLAILT